MQVPAHGFLSGSGAHTCGTWEEDVCVESSCRSAFRVLGVVLEAGEPRARSHQAQSALGTMAHTHAHARAYART